MRLHGSRRRIVLRWATWLAVLVLVTTAMLFIRGALDKAHVTLVFLLVVLGASASGGRVLGLSIAGLAFLTFNFFFLPPYYTLTLENQLDWLVLFAFLVTSAVAAQLLHRANATAAAATARAEEVDRLAALGAETLNAAGVDEALHAIAEVIRASVDVDDCDIYNRLPDGRAALAVRASRAAADFSISNRERTTIGGGGSHQGALVDWIVDHGSSAVELEDGTVRVARELRPASDAAATGSANETMAALAMITRRDEGAARVPWLRAHASNGAPLPHDGAPAIRALALPLRVRDHTVGVLRIAKTTSLELTGAQGRLLAALAYYAALGVERARLVATAERAEAERRLEKLRNALLTALSHDLRTPLTTIRGIATEILRGGDTQRAAIIESEADRLDALVGDLLALSRIHAGAVQPQLAVNTVDDLVGAALRQAGGALREHRVDVRVENQELLAGNFDLTQTLRILVNLLDNAAKYSPPGSTVELSVRRTGDRLLMAVMDRGAGVPDAERDRIFEPFYRVPRVAPDVRGTGLGLSIARGLAEAQGGGLSFSPRPGGGSVFTLDLPAADALAPEGSAPPEPSLS